MTTALSFRDLSCALNPTLLLSLCRGLPSPSKTYSTSVVTSLDLAIQTGRGVMRQPHPLLLLFWRLSKKGLFVLVKQSWMRWHTGGSSSGSAVAVAAGLVDFSIGTDTGGSVRVPAAYCGMYGFRPSHGVISTCNAIPMSQSFDTVGWFARDPCILSRVGHVLLSLPVDATQQPSRVVIPEDVFQYLGSPADQVSHILIRSVEKMFGRNVIKHESLGDYICHKVPSLSIFMSKISGDTPSAFPAFAALSYSMRLLQRFEFKCNHEEWLKTTKPNLGPGISERVSEALESTSENLDFVKASRAELEAALTDLLEEHGVLAIPTVPGPPPKLRTETAALENFRAKAFSLLSIAGMSRFCQVTLPLGMHNGFPVSMSLLAGHGADHFLLNIAQAIYGALQEQATIAWEVGK